MTTFLTLGLLRITQGKSDSQNQKLPRIRIRIHDHGYGSADPDPDPNQNDMDPKHCNFYDNSQIFLIRD